MTRPQASCPLPCRVQTEYFYIGDVEDEETVVKDETELRVTADGSVAASVAHAITLFNEQDKKTVTITGTGNAITKAVKMAGVAKRRFTSLSSTEIGDEYEPRDKETALEDVTEIRVTAGGSDAEYATCASTLFQEKDTEGLDKVTDTRPFLAMR